MFEDNDPFNLAPIILGLNVNTQRGPVEENGLDFNDLEDNEEEIARTSPHSVHTPDVLEIDAAAPNTSHFVGDGKNMENEIQLTTKLGSTVGVDLSDFQELIHESIVKEGVQSGFK